MSKFLKRLKKGPILFDGGLGTELYNKGIFINRCFEELNLSNPDLVKSVHEEYVRAGADIIETNTYGANFYKLAPFQLQDKLYEINFQGAKLAREVAGENVFVAGSIGPLGIQVEPLGIVSYKEAFEHFKFQIQALVDGGVDLIIFETFIYPKTLQIAVDAAKSISNIPVIALMTIDDDTSSLTGASPEVMIQELEKTKADVIGINCTVGPKTMLQWLEEARPLTQKPICIMPNAGTPKNIDGRNIYLTSPEYMGEYAKHFIQTGANIIGGCCGTSPEHIKRMRNMIDAIQPELKRSKIKIVKMAKVNELEPMERKLKSRLARQISDGKYVKFVELLPPRGVDATKELERAREMHYYGIDVINIPDGPRASARMSAMALALKIQNEVGIETVLHFVCRDRNVIGMQSDLMGAYSLGLKNILAITGDPPKLGNYPDATAVFDVDAIGLVNILNRLNHGLDIAGNPIGNKTSYYVGVGANPGAIDLENELRRLDWKVEAGAEYIVTQPVFDIPVFEKFIERISHINLPVIVGLWPLVSYRNAEFMNNEVPGVNIPVSIMQRMKKYENDKDEAAKVGIEIAIEALEKVKSITQGVQISAPFGRVQSVVDILSGIKI